MKTTSITDILATEADLTDVLATLELQSEGNRFHAAYALVREVQESRKVGRSVPAKRQRLLPFAIHDLSELTKILDTIDVDTERTVLQGKFKDLLSGTLDRSLESTANNHARNIQFELVLLSDMRIAGLAASLELQNPDLIVRSSSRKYGIEAKRLFSDSPRAVEKRTRDAVNQLTRHYMSPDKTKRGLVALSLDRYFNQGDKFLSAQDAWSANEKLRLDSKQFIESHKKLWQDNGVMKDPDIWIVVYVSTAAYLETEGISAHAAFVTVTNGLQSPRGKQLLRDCTRDIIEPLRIGLESF